MSAAFGATALTKSACLLSGLTRRGRPRRNRFDDAFVNKKEKEKRERQEFPGFSLLLLLPRAHVSARDDWSGKRESMVRVPIAQI